MSVFVGEEKPKCDRQCRVRQIKTRLHADERNLADGKFAEIDWVFMVIDYIPAWIHLNSRCSFTYLNGNK